MTASAARVDTASISTVYIGIGSNLCQPLEQVRRARDALAALPKTRLMGTSPLYRNPAIGPGGQPDYVNAVAAIETRLEPHELLDALQAIEADQGRTRGAIRWQPRTVDLDLLVYGDRAIRDQGLTVPHPHMHERAFVLKPLVDLAPDLDVPGLGPVAALLSGVPDGMLRRVDDPGDAH
jgi:2-amino-4-hydroxy-6-hydroxymethyldihydropteridine diphosphokinase